MPSGGNEAVTSLLPTSDPTGQPEAPASNTVSLQRTVAPGLTLSPTGRSTLTVFSSSTGVSPGGSFLMMNCVNPQFGCAPAVSKNCAGVAIEQSSAPGSGGSALQVPACQPESTEGCAGSLGAMMSPVSASAAEAVDAATRRHAQSKRAARAGQPHCGFFLPGSILNRN